jgi:hypothetical protein
LARPHRRSLSAFSLQTFYTIRFEARLMGQVHYKFTRRSGFITSAIAQAIAERKGKEAKLFYVGNALTRTATGCSRGQSVANVRRPVQRNSAS